MAENSVGRVTPPSEISASGFCAACGTVHSLPVGNSRKYALELLRQLEEFERINWVGTAVPAVRGRLGDTSLPSKISTDYLFGDPKAEYEEIALESLCRENFIFDPTARP